jgi:hypothetical protein
MISRTEGDYQAGHNIIAIGAGLIIRRTAVTGKGASVIYNKVEARNWVS